jgi:DNA-binding transcriptional ArsR family regulator
MTTHLRLADEAADDADTRLNEVFAALSDPVRRAILAQLDGRDLLVSELAAPFDISLQAVSRHIQVLVRAGLIEQRRSGRISRCSLVAGPIHDAAVWINRYSKYWQEQFDLLALALTQEERKTKTKRKAMRRRRGIRPAARAGQGAKRRRP